MAVVWGKDEIVNVEDGSTCEPAFYDNVYKVWTDDDVGYDDGDEDDDDGYDDEEADDGLRQGQDSQRWRWQRLWTCILW